MNGKCNKDIKEGSAVRNMKRREEDKWSEVKFVQKSICKKETEE